MSGGHYYNPRMVQIIQENIKTDKKAAGYAKKILDEAEKHLSLGNDFWWNFVTNNSLPRGAMPGERNSGCPECGDAFLNKYGVYGWVCLTENNRWKIQCPHCGSLFPSNDFKKYYEKCNIDFEQDEIIITYGGSEAIILSLMAIGDPGDEVLVPEPFYANYNGFACEAGLVIKPITTKAEEGFHLPSKEYIKSLIKPNTRAIMISNPCNPTGTVYTKGELKMLGEIALEHDIFLIGDEVYREFVYDGLEFTSLMHIPEIRDRVIICDSISKRYSACGARIGCVCSKNKDFMKTIMKFAQARLCVATIEMLGATSLINTTKEYFQEVNKEYCLC